MSKQIESRKESTPKTWSCVSCAIVSMLALGGLVVLSIALLYFGFRAREASGRAMVEEQIAAIQQRGLPIDNASMEHWYRANTSDENTQAWLNVFSYLKSPEYVALGKGIGSMDSTVSEETGPTPTGWPQEARYREFVNATQLVRNEIHRLCADDKPICFPIKFNGAGTLLEPIQDSRLVSRLMGIEFQVVRADKDSDAIRQNLESGIRFSKLFSKQPCIVSSMVRFGIRNMLWSNLKTAIVEDLLTVSDLERVHQSLLKNADYNSVWSEMIATERACCISAFENVGMAMGGKNSAFQGMAASSHDKLRFIRFLSQAEPLSLDSPDEFLQQLSDIESTLRQDFKNAGILGAREMLVSQQLVPALNAAGIFVVQDLLAFNITETALRIRRFKKANGDFPASLEVLDATFPSTKLVTLPGGKPLGYENLGKSCRLWGNLQDSKRNFLPVSSSPPEVSGDSDKVLDLQLERSLFELH